jgi:hypothetical protein
MSRIGNTGYYRMCDLLLEDKNSDENVQDEENGEKVEKDNIKYLIAVYRCTTNRYPFCMKIFSYTFLWFTMYVGYFRISVLFHVHLLYTRVVDLRWF